MLRISKFFNLDKGLSSLVPECLLRPSVEGLDQERQPFLDVLDKLGFSEPFECSLDAPVFRCRVLCLHFVEEIQEIFRDIFTVRAKIGSGI